LPAGLGVGSGCVIDTYGNTSKQQDIIIYEKFLCPRFSINNTPESTYFPCEGVLAVGEVKSSIGSKELTDSLDKIASVKSLRRHAEPSNSLLVNEPTVSFRTYCNTTAYVCTKDEEFNQEKESFDQIFGFIICGKFALKTDTLMSKIAGHLSSILAILAPNLIVSLSEGVIAPYCSKSNTLHHALSDFTGYVFGQNDGNYFEYLLSKILVAYRRGRTSELHAFERYISFNDKMTLQIKEIVKISA
jgi:hypothetical protein